MNEEKAYSLCPLGDSAILINFDNIINEGVNKKVLAFFNQIKQSALPGIRDIVPAYCSLAIHYDPLLVSNKHHTAFEYYSDQVTTILNSESEDVQNIYRMIRIPVCYSKKFGVDLNTISIARKISVEEIIALHSGKKYRIYMIGFLPGFAYMGEIDEKIRMPRLSQPRFKIEAGSVGIAGKQTGIYPVESPGGWQIIGRTPISIFNNTSEDPVLFQPGDEVQFYSITEDEFKNY